MDKHYVQPSISPYVRELKYPQTFTMKLSTKQRLRDYCDENKLSMSSVAEEAIEKWLDTHEVSNGD